MLVEELLFEIRFKNNGFKQINDCILDEIYENLYSYKHINQEIYDKIIGFLHANSAIVESIDRTLSIYQDKIDEHYAQLLKTDI